MLELQLLTGSNRVATLIIGYNILMAQLSGTIIHNTGIENNIYGDEVNSYGLRRDVSGRIRPLLIPVLDMIYLVGLGLWMKQLTREAVEALSASDEVYLDVYTNVSYDITQEFLSSLIGKPVKLASRDILEYPGLKKLVEKAKDSVISVAVIGDPLMATTHTIIIEEAINQNVSWEIIHGISGVYVAQLETMLHPYKFGKITTLTYPFNSSYPYTSLRTVYQNLCLGLHTLLLMDLKIDENMFMRFHEGIRLLFEMEEEKWGTSVLNDLLGIAVIRAGTPGKRIITNELKKLAELRDDKVPQSLVIPGLLHITEKENLKNIYKVRDDIIEHHQEILKSNLSTYCKRAGIMLEG